MQIGYLVVTIFVALAHQAVNALVYTYCIVRYNHESDSTARALESVKWVSVGTLRVLYCICAVGRTRLSDNLLCTTMHAALCTDVIGTSGLIFCVLVQLNVLNLRFSTTNCRTYYCRFIQWQTPHVTFWLDITRLTVNVAILFLPIGQTRNLTLAFWVSHRRTVQYFRLSIYYPFSHFYIYYRRAAKTKPITAHPRNLPATSLCAYFGFRVTPFHPPACPVEQQSTSAAHLIC